MINDWANAKLEDVLDYIQPTNYIVNSVEYSDEYKTPVLTAGKSFIIGYTNEENGIFDRLPTIIFDDFTTSIQFVNFKFKVKSSAMKILVPTSNLVDIRYVFYLMKTLRVNTDTHKRFWISIFSQLPIKIAPFPEQRVIADQIEEMFSDLDNAIENLKKAQEQLRVYRQAVLKCAFEGKLISGTGAPQRIKLSELTNLITKGASPRWQGIKYVEDTQVLFVTSENVRENYLDISSPKYVEDKFNVKQKRSILQKGDVLLNIVGASIGRSTTFELDETANINQAVALIRCNQGISNQYLSHYLNSTMAFNFYDSRKVDVARPNLSLTDVANIPVPHYEIDIQEMIVAEIERRLSVSNKMEETINENIQKAEALRQSILKQAFEGKLTEQWRKDHQDLISGENSAEALLKKIKAEK